MGKAKQGGNEEMVKIKKAWIDIEMEHATLFPKAKQRIMAKKIACQHVAEMGKGYYPGLIKLEKKLKGRKK